MKSNELRVGNLVKQNFPNEDSEKWFVADFITINCAQNYDPIPLSREIIKKAGFEKDGDGVYLKQKCLYWIDEGILQIAIGYAPMINAPCKYLHQLQNIIFALTGEELILHD